MNGRDIGTVVFPRPPSILPGRRNIRKSGTTAGREREHNPAATYDKHSQISLSAIAATPHALIRLGLLPTTQS